VSLIVPSAAELHSTEDPPVSGHLLNTRARSRRRVAPRARANKRNLSLPLLWMEFKARQSRLVLITGTNNGGTQ